MSAPAASSEASSTPLPSASSASEARRMGALPARGGSPGSRGEIHAALSSFFTALPSFPNTVLKRQDSQSRGLRQASEEHGAVRDTRRHFRQESLSPGMRVR